MPSLTPDDRRRFLGPVGVCPTCRTSALRHYCRSHDEYFFTCDCFPPDVSEHVKACRIYLWTHAGILAIPDFDTFPFEQR